MTHSKSLSLEQILGHTKGHHDSVRDRQVLILCPHHKQLSPFIRVSSLPEDKTIPSGYRNISATEMTSYHFLKCINEACNKPIMLILKSKLNKVGKKQTGEIYSRPEQDIWFATAEIYPFSSDSPIINEVSNKLLSIFTLQELEPIYSSLREGWKCECAKSIRGAGAMYRLALEGFLDLLADKKGFQEEYSKIKMVGPKIKFLNKKLKLNETKLLEAVDVIKSFGNDADHPDTKFFQLVEKELEQIKQIFQIIINVLSQHEALAKLTADLNSPQ